MSAFAVLTARKAVLFACITVWRHLLPADVGGGAGWLSGNAWLPLAGPLLPPLFAVPGGPCKNRAGSKVCIRDRLGYAVA